MVMNAIIVCGVAVQTLIINFRTLQYYYPYNILLNMRNYCNNLLKYTIGTIGTTAAV